MRPFLLATTLLPIAFFLFATKTMAQDSTSASTLKIGQWEQHLPWQRSIWVTQSAEKIWFATEWAILELQKSDRAPRYITPTDGLSETGMGPIKYDAASGTLIVTYFNSNIDLLKNGLVTNIPFIKTNTTILGDKKIYDIFVENGAAWFCCGFGIAKFSLDAQEFEFTTFTGLPVWGMASLGDFFYAATDDGIYRAAKNGANLADFSTWELLGPADGLPADFSSKVVHNFQGKLVFDINGKKLATLSPGQPPVDFYPIDPKFRIKYLTSEGPGLLAGLDCVSTTNCGSAPLLRFSDLASAPQVFTQEVNFPLQSVEDEAGQIWHSDGYDNLRLLHVDGGWGEAFNYNSPFRQGSAAFLFAEGRTFMAAGTVSSQPKFTYDGDGFYSFKKTEGWQTFNRKNQPIITNEGIDFDFWRMAYNKESKKLWVGSFYGGLVEFDPATGQVLRGFTKNNSLLQGAIGDAARTQIGGLAFDSEQNLWISNYKSGKPIVVLKKDGDWKRFNAPVGNGETFHMAIDKNDFKWFAAGTTGGIYVLDSGADIDDEGDDKSRTVTSSNSVLPSNRVNCFALDLDGDMWVGTDKGMVGFQCGSNILSAECGGSWPIVDIDGFLQNLLKDNDIRCIAIDGANRKWVGTTTGVFVFSPDCTETVARFTTENSPLFDNIITAIGINSANGDVWVGTEKGVITFRTDATDGTSVNQPDSYAFPNPVMPNYDGPIAINGLARDANIKIVDVNGQLVFEGKSLGGQAVWDARDYLGRRVASGVYLVLATGTAVFDSPEASVVAKIVVMN